ncbi:zinc ABC transporter substrate-binding protein ZnuA [Chelativorans intermedius]|uniref:High-affinity zinc uptake system protein ZnuA n=1 Tax=Chelativorans intermedius TaxID=515947 RepID=A0ABV6DCQ4_9HYPH|nr:zinc ABC transporter substrate-binding protein ZnuA [Chelativorans intermedius]MCT8999072.1 zinc ABC transporter substrate-binding protein ZnuA [Chelativorans intermedius]
MKKLRLFLSASALAVISLAAPATAKEGVVASIKPIHSLVAAVMQGVGEPQLLVKGADSPHVYSMRPSEARMLEEARLVFWVGPGLEVFLEKPLQSLAGDATVVELAQTPGLTLLAPREGGAFEAHAHGEEEHHAGVDEGHDHHDHDHEHEHETGHEGAPHDGHEDHAHGEADMHLWLDPENARRMTARIAEALAEADPQNAVAYAQNAAALDRRFDALIAETKKKLAAVSGKPFVVFHDAYHYFERRFDIPAAGSITVNPDTQPGARRLGEIRDKIVELGAVCVFSEPQFEPKVVQVVTEGTDARAGVLDPLGAGIEDGPELYFTLVGNMADALSDCLSGA